MPGRYFLISSPETVSEAFGVVIDKPFPSRYNIAPTLPVAIVRQSERRTREFALVRWGFIPSWQKKPETKPLINARSETVAEKPSFRSAYKRRRCLVPADGYYEWKTQGKLKQPHCVRRADESLFAFAGIWETAADPSGGEIDTLAILTTEPNPEIEPLHHREGVVITPENYALWLEADERDIDALAGMLRPSPAGSWKYYAVSPNVGSPRNDGPGLILPFRETLFD